jgi:DNA (cytosine-5)-methyltransferase 1
MRTHSYNFLSKSIQQDIRTIADPVAFLQELGLDRVDVIIGGPPCQGYSLIGRGKLKSLGAEREAYYRDVLNNLYQEFTRFVMALQPLAFVMENVPSMAHYDSGELVERIKQSFPGYNAVDNRLLNAVHYGVPQNRERLFIQGNRLGMRIHWPDVPQVFDNPLTVAEAIGDLPPRDPGMLDDEVLPYHFPPDPTDYQRRMRERMPTDHLHIVWDHIHALFAGQSSILIIWLKQQQRILFPKKTMGPTIRAMAYHCAVPIIGLLTRVFLL